MAPLSILIIEKTGTVKETAIKSFDESELYKKAGFKTADGFKCYTTWDIEELDGASYSISVYGKTTGRANQENKYEFPPPIDNTLFFGSCVIINKRSDVLTNITSKEWDKIYDHLYGGFEDLGEEDSEEESEGDDEDVVKTKTGYAKDGFVVDDDYVEEDNESCEEYSQENDDEDDIPRTTKSKTTKKSKNVKPQKIILKKKPLSKTKKQPETFTIFGKIIGKAAVASKKSSENLTSQDENTLECTSELSEESYIE
uniref:Uncharacterized protein n=1 Tax=viral metagenome TaxID=1070528 RepID=A0A6C0DKR3_9ZZZZ